MQIKDTVHFNWYKHLFVVVVLLVCFQSSVVLTGADFQAVFQNSNQMGIFLARFLKPDFSYLPNLLMPLVKTLQMSVIGTFLGVLFAVPISFLATQVVTKQRMLSYIIRFFLGVIRTIPNLLLAALFVAVFGIGEQLVS